MRGVALSEDGMEQAGMGVGIGDYNLDGHLDMFKTHFCGRQPTCSTTTTAKAISMTSPKRPRSAVETRYISWGAGIVDLDNDGYPDIFSRHRQRLPRSGAQAFPQISLQDPACSFAIWATARSKKWREAGPGIADASLPAADAPSAISTTTATWTSSSST